MSIGREALNDRIFVQDMNGERRSFRAPSGRRLYSQTTPAEDSWVKLELDAFDAVASVSIMKGFESSQIVGLPPIPNSVLDSYCGLIKAELDRWAAGGRPQIPGLTGKPSGILVHPADYEEALANKDKVVTFWRLAPMNRDLPANASILVLEPAVRYKTKDGRDLMGELWFRVDKFALVDFDPLLSGGSISATIADAPWPLSFLGRSQSLAMDFIPPNTRQLSIRAVSGPAKVTLPSRVSTPTPNSGFSSRDIQISRNRDYFVISGTTAKASMEYWTEIYKRTDAGAALVTCAECSQEDYSTLFDVQRQIDFRAPKIPAGTLVFAPQWADFLKFDRDLKKMLFLSGDYVRTVDIATNKVLLNTQAALPILVENNVAITQSERHQLKLYDLSPN
jgi:hypothetical protein